MEGLRGAKEVDGRGSVRPSSRPRAERCFDSNRPASISNRGQPQKFTVVRCVTVTATVTGCVSPSHGHVIVPWNFWYIFRGKTFIEGGVTSRKHVSDGRDARQLIHIIFHSIFAACKSECESSPSVCDDSCDITGSQRTPDVPTLSPVYVTPPPNDNSRFHRHRPFFGFPLQ